MLADRGSTSSGRCFPATRDLCAHYDFQVEVVAGVRHYLIEERPAETIEPI
jgi:hypothetical protein